MAALAHTLLTAMLHFEQTLWRKGVIFFFFHVDVCAVNPTCSSHGATEAMAPSVLGYI